MEDMAELIALMNLGRFFLGLTEEVDWVLLPGIHYICMCILLVKKWITAFETHIFFVWQ
jgi:hypothetical protein